MGRRKTRYTGVYERPSATRKFQGKSDLAYDICYKQADGKLVWKTAGWRSEGMTAAEAADMRQDLVRRMRSMTNAALTMGEAWEMYRRDWLEQEQKPSLYHDTLLYNKHIGPRLSRLPLGKIAPLHVNAIMRDMAELSPQTRQHVLAMIRRIYRKMATWRVWRGDLPTEGISPGEIDNERKRYLTRREAQMLLLEAECRSPELADMCRLSLYAGLRRGEIFALQAQHIDFEGGVISIMDAKAGSRLAVMSEHVAEVLRRRCAGKAPQDFIFTRSGGRPHEQVPRMFESIVNDLGLNDGITDRRHKVVFHTLRHTFGSWLVQGDVPLYTVSDLMGHSSIEMTKRYAKLADDNRRKAVAMLPDLA